MSDVVQRWRIVYERGPDARGLAQREELEAWERAVLASGLPAVGADASRPRLTFAAPLPAGLDACADRFDLPLVARCTRADVRAALERETPPGHGLRDVHDVWTGEPAITGRVVAADYRLVVDAAAAILTPAVGDLLAASTLPRVRRRGERETAYDLRPLVLGLRVEPADPSGDTVAALEHGPDAAATGVAATVLRARLVVSPSLGAGRPDEVVAALGEATSRPIAILEGCRERIWLADEVPLDL